MQGNIERASEEQYHREMFDYAIHYVGYSEVAEIMAGDKPEISGTGITALSEWVHKSLERHLNDSRPPVVSERAYRDTLQRELEQLPNREAKAVLDSERRLWSSGIPTNESLWGEIAVLQVAEEMFEVDYTNEISEILKHLPESESKIDLLEDRKLIGGDEWHERTEQIQEAT
jgi:hypothetical protein